MMGYAARDARMLNQPPIRAPTVNTKGDPRIYINHPFAASGELEVNTNNVVASNKK